MAVNLLSDLTEAVQEMSGDYEKLLDLLQDGGELDDADQQVRISSQRAFLPHCSPSLLSLPSVPLMWELT